MDKRRLTRLKVEGRARRRKARVRAVPVVVAEQGKLLPLSEALRRWGYTPKQIEGFQESTKSF
jgi:hypothetical protein